MRMTHLAGSMLGATALLATAVAPASAATTTKYDASGDVTVCSANDDCRIVSNRSENDMTKVVTVHTADRVAVRASFRDLRMFGSDTRRLSAYIATDEGRHFSITASWAPNHTTPTFQLYDERLHALQPSVCKGATAKLEDAWNRAILSVPRACLSNPGWVRTIVDYKRHASNGVTVRDTSFTAEVPNEGWDSIDLQFGPTTYKG